MGRGLRLDGTIIPRRVKRMFDQRHEARADLAAGARIEWRGRDQAVGLVNLSASGAMVLCSEIPRIGEKMTLRLPQRAPIACAVRWVRNGRLGLHFTPTVE